MIKRKDSRIEWIGEIPEDWKVIRNKYVMHKDKSLITKYNNEDILSLTMNGVIKRNLDAGGKMPSSFNGYQKINKGNLLLCLFDIDVTPRCVGIIQNNGITSPAYSQFILTDNNDVRFYYYYYLVTDNKKALVHLSKNLRHSLTEEQFGNLDTIRPPLDQQRAIADFLDKKCADIDKLSVQIQKEIEALQEYRKSVITKAVTKGLDDNVPMKDSGIEWIGKIPKNWKISKIKYEADYIGSGSTPNSSNYELYDGNVFWIQSGDLYRKRTITNTQVKVTEKAIKTTSSLKIIKKDFIVIAMYGGSIGNISMSKISACTNQAVCAIKPNKNNDIKFLYYWLSFCKDDFFRKASGGTQPNINQIIIKNEFIPRIPLIEQEKIVNYLDNEVNLIEKIISHKQRQQQLLKKYKHSLIYDFVTGKKQVPSVGEE